MILKNYFTIRLFALFTLSFALLNGTAAQSYVFGSGALGFTQYGALNDIVQGFNTAENHILSPMNNLFGYEIGIGLYGERTLMEAKFANLSRRIDSNVPGNPIENASVDYSYNYFSYAFGLRPIKKIYFTFGGALNLGKINLRHSFGGDWINSNNDYMASTDIFIDYAFPIKLKKRRNPYLFRIRPYYQQTFGTIALRQFDANLNEKPIATITNTELNLNHFGIKASIIIPLRKDVALRKKAN